MPQMLWKMGHIFMGVDAFGEELFEVRKFHICSGRLAVRRVLAMVRIVAEAMRGNEVLDFEGLCGYPF